VIDSDATLAIGKARAACAQSFALWQQATIEITRRNHFIIACSRQIYVVLFCAHIPFVVNRAFSATPAERLQQPLLPFTTNRIDRTFLWRFHTARPSHPGHNITLLRSESPSGMLLFIQYKTTWLTVVRSHCLAVLPDKDVCVQQSQTAKRLLP